MIRRRSLTRAVAPIFALALSLAVASSSAQSTTTTASSAIPTGISTSCTAFFAQLNSDTTIRSCTQPLLSATRYYTNDLSDRSSAAASEQALQESLSELCASDAGCDSDLVRQYLSSFWTSCMTEIREENKDVQDVYDVLYLLVPFREAICSKDDDGDYCLLDTANSSSSTSSTKRDLENTFPKVGLSMVGSPKLGLASTLIKKIKGHGAVAKNVNRRDNFAASVEMAQELLPRQSTADANQASSALDGLNGTNIAFLFLQPTSDQEVLCGTCAQGILAAYIKFETALPYAIGLSNSQILGGQSALYKAGQATCGDDWATSVNVVAGTTDFAKVAAAGMVKMSLGVLVLSAGAAAVTLLL